MPAKFLSVFAKSRASPASTAETEDPNGNNTALHSLAQWTTTAMAVPAIVINSRDSPTLSLRGDKTQLSSSAVPRRLLTPPVSGTTAGSAPSTPGSLRQVPTGILIINDLLQRSLTSINLSEWSHDNMTSKIN
jgi:hypothetical protein